MTNIDTIMVNHQANEEQDRFSMVLNATYQQWDSPPTSVILRLGRLVDENKNPVVVQRFIVKAGQRVQLQMYDLIKGQFELCIQNKTKPFVPDPENPQLPPYLVVFKKDDEVPFAFNRIERLTWVTPTTDIEVKAINGDVTIAYYGFPE